MSLNRPSAQLIQVPERKLTCALPGYQQVDVLEGPDLGPLPWRLQPLPDFRTHTTVEHQYPWSSSAAKKESRRTDEERLRKWYRGHEASALRYWIPIDIASILRPQEIFKIAEITKFAVDAPGTTLVDQIVAACLDDMITGSRGPGWRGLVGDAVREELPGDSLPAYLDIVSRVCVLGGAQLQVFGNNSVCFEHGGQIRRAGEVCWQIACLPMILPPRPDLTHKTATPNAPLPSNLPPFHVPSYLLLGPGFRSRSLAV